jgi:hypothetical protein
LITLVLSVRAAPDAEAGRSLIERALSSDVANFVSAAEIEAIRARIVALPSVPARPVLERDDLLAALAIFLIVVAATFPVVLPFVWIGDVGTAKNVSATRFIGMLAALASAVALADGDDGSGRRASRPAKPSWEFGVTAYPTNVRGGENYTSAIAVADRGPLHLELRHNYEAINATSAFVGWTFSGGEAVAWELTPLLGAVRGTKQAFAPGLEASVTWGRLDYYIEAEYVDDRKGRADSYLYAWSELGFGVDPFPWTVFRLGHKRLSTGPCAGA